MRRVFLIHGMGRTPASMWILHRRLRAAGYHPSLFGYFVTAQDMDEITESFSRHVERVTKADEDRGGADGYAVVSHSLGGIVTRLAGPRLPDGFRAFVMLAPPNRRPVVVEALGGNPLFRLITQDAGARLRDPAFYDALPVPRPPTLVVAGNGGPTAAWLPFGGEPNDGILRVDETVLDGAATLEVPAMHTFLMNRGDVFEAVRAFFAEHGFDAGRVC